MPFYSKAKPDTFNRLAKVMDKYHGGLRDCGLLVDILMAHPNLDDNGDPKGPAVKCHGYPAIATIRVLGLKDRVARGWDAEMVIDSDWWETASRQQQDAVLDHELTHLEPATDSEGAVKRDDAERPKLKIRKHDRQLGWFDTVAHRHGESSQEVIQCRDMLASETFKQCYLFDGVEV